MEQAAPISMTSSRLTGWPRPSASVLAAAMGPGVGGIKQWETYRPMDSATAAATEEVPVRLTSALRMGFRMTKPLSQKTGMETIQPISIIASSGRFLPTILTTVSAILSAAPVFSSRLPTSAPRMMTMPMLVKVPEKPWPMMPGIFTSSMPATMARSSDTSIRLMKACTLNLEISTIMRTTAITNAIKRGTPVITKPPIR